MHSCFEDGTKFKIMCPACTTEEVTGSCSREWYWCTKCEKYFRLSTVENTAKKSLKILDLYQQEKK